MTELDQITHEMEQMQRHILDGSITGAGMGDLKRWANRLRLLSSAPETGQGWQPKDTARRILLWNGQIMRNTEPIRKAFLAGLDAAAELWTELPIEWTADTRQQYQAKVDAAFEAYLTAEQAANPYVNGT